jgi:hypothetical protein
MDMSLSPYEAPVGIPLEETPEGSLNGTQEMAGQADGGIRRFPVVRARLRPPAAPERPNGRIDANETTETFRRNAAQTFVHMLSSRDPQTPSVEQNLDSELSWEGRGSAGPDTTTLTQPRSPREQSN